jgi:endoglucanase
MAKKARLGVDHWGSLDTEIRHIMTPIEETFTKEYPDFDPFPFGQLPWITTLVRNILLAEPMVDDFGRRFADVTRVETVRELADSFRLENCAVRERLAGILSASAR